MPILDDQSLEFISHSTDQTRRVGMRLGALIQPGDAICLIGELGAGKTTLVQGLSSGWGSLDPVTSPSFVLVNVYRRPDGGSLFHLDAYRLNSAVEAEDLDIDSFIARGPLVVEWADRVQDALPAQRLSVAFHWIDDDQRDLMFTAFGPRYQTLLNNFRRQVFGAY